MLLHLFALSWLPLMAWATCMEHNNCNAHGVCRSHKKTCECYVGYGHPTDIAEYKAPDCSQKVCPVGKAWADVPTSATEAHAPAECSGKGLCDRETGLCACFAGFAGDACQRLLCPTATTGECSGHGTCVSMKRMATMTNAFPLSPATTYIGNPTGNTWDEDKIFGCVCDSSWTVGLGAGERQKAEWFGIDCSMRRCPSANDPLTTADETDCSGVAAEGGVGTGASGNLCHVDCANRGICDYTTGTCTCFNGFHSQDCSKTSIYAVS